MIFTCIHSLLAIIMLKQFHSFAMNSLLSLFFFLLTLSFLHVNSASARQISNHFDPKQNPFTPKSYLIRYWNQQVTTKSPHSPFLLSKASPLTAVDSATFAKLAENNTLSTALPSFCSSAKLFCFPDVSPSLEKHAADAGFTEYQNRNFTNYGTGGTGMANSFKNYSNRENVPLDSFRRYSRDAVGHDDRFTTYATEANVADQSFNTYGTTATGGKGNFKNYQEQVNVPNLRFNSYSDDANARAQSFTTYGQETNSGSESFTSYGKNGNDAQSEFVSYAKNTNTLQSGFKNYGRDGNVANNTFKSYGEGGNSPQHNFKSYGDGDNGGVESFISYTLDSNVGGNNFKSYAKNSNSEEVKFSNYEQTNNDVLHEFSGYGKGAQNQEIEFKSYSPHRTFKDYAKKNGVVFSEYRKAGTSSGVKSVNKWVEQGKFFRESMLKKGTVMPMPDIKDKMPQRSFLPRSITSKLPFSTTRLSELKKLFHANDNSTMESIIKDALSECERAPSQGETKRCVGSAEDMIDFATSVLGGNVALRTTQSVSGSKQNIVIGSVKGINGGKVTKSVSCHQSLYPYLLYYCHSVPKVRVYEADILDQKTKAKINHGVAICHLDTSAWSSTHGAFLALGSDPGRIEVCHWIFENDLTWTIAD